jgi:uncharacterized protein Smg (DUF494 family)
MSDRIPAILQALRARFGATATTDDLADHLAAEGFDRRQIDEIVARFRAQVRDERGAADPHAADPDEDAGRDRQPPVRVLGPHEWGRFTPEAWGRLLALGADGAISTLDFERLIDRALEQGEGRVDLPGLRALLDGIGIGDPDAAADALTIH